MQMNPLYRQLENKNKYGKYIPLSNCTPTFVGTGDTRFSLVKMADVVDDNLTQGKLLADVLKGKDIASTCANIHNFLYHNFQYKADASNQILRSLSCSWLERETGIDCKSYSIAAGIILSNMGLSFAFRRVKQPSWLPSQYTHVYVVVYANQTSKNTNDGLFIIDGTLPHINEVQYSQKDDLPIVVTGLGFSFSSVMNLVQGATQSNNSGTASNSGASTVNSLVQAGASLIPGGQFIASMIDFEKYTKSFGEAFSAPGGIFANLSCIGGSAFDSGNLTNTIAQMNAYYPQVIISINKAVEKYMNEPRPLPQNFNPVGEAYLEAHKNLSAIVTTHHNFFNSNNWQSSCTVRNLNLLKEYGQSMYDKLWNLIGAYIKTYFDEIPGPQSPYDYNSRCIASGAFNIDYTLCSGSGPGRGGSTNIGNPGINQYNIKPGITQIPILDFTPPVQAYLSNGGNIDIKDALSQVKTVINLFSKSTQGGSNNTVLPVNAQDTNNTNTTQAGIQQMNWGQIGIAAAVIGGAVYYGMKKSKE